MVAFAFIQVSVVRASYDLAPTSQPSAGTAVESQTTVEPQLNRYGPFGLLDRRSTYGTYWFPEPLRADEMDVDREVRVDYFHNEKSGEQDDEVRPEVEYNFGLLTVDAETSYEWTSESHFDPTQGKVVRNRTEGLGNVSLAARAPVFEFVAPSQNFDYTLAGGFELGIPTGSAISKDTELVPSLFHLMRIGQHVSLQIATGFSFLVGPDEPVNTLETNAVLGYTFEHDELPIPGVLSTVPIFELDNETALSGQDRGTNSLLGVVGARFNMNSIGPAQPRPGIGFVFPLDAGGRDEMRWGIVVSVNFEL